MGRRGALVVGRVAGAHGIRGEVIVLFHEGSDRDLKQGDPIRLQIPGSPPVSHQILRVRPHKRGFIAALDGITDRNRAEAITGAEVVIDRAELPPLGDGEFYWTDLIGLSVYDRDRRFLGTLTAIFPTGSNDVYVVRDGDAEVLVPALEKVVVSVDLEAGVMQVDLPDGL